MTCIYIWRRKRLPDFDFKICIMEKADVPAVAELERECFSSPWSENALLDALESEVSLFLAAKSRTDIVGYIGISVILDEAYVSNIAVTKTVRRRGVGKALLGEAERLCRERGCSFLSLEVRESNLSAVSLYESCGFSVCGKRKNFYTHPREDALIMTKFNAAKN